MFSITLFVFLAGLSTVRVFRQSGSSTKYFPPSPFVRYIFRQPVRVPERSYFRHPRSCSRAVLFSGAPVRERFVFSALSLEFRARAPTHRGFLGATQLPARTGLAHPPPAEGTLSEARRHPARLASASPAHPRLPGPRPPSPRRLGDPLRERYLSRSRGSPSPSFIQ